MAPLRTLPLLLLLLLLLPGGGPAGPPPGWLWGGAEDPGGGPSPPKLRCNGERAGPRCPPRLRLDVSASPEFPPAPGPRAVPAGARVFVQISLSRAPPGLGFSLRRCSVSPRSAPGGGPGAAPRPLVVLRGGCGGAAGTGPGLGAGGGPGGARRRLLLSFRLPPRFAEPLQFLHCRLRLCRTGAAGAAGTGLPACRAEPCPRRGGGASGSGPAPRRRPGPAPSRALRTVSRPIVVTLGAAGTAPPGAPPGPFLPPPPPLRRPQPPPPDRPRPPPADPAVPPGAVAAVSFGAFVVGAALAGGLWVVHGRTAAPRPPPAPPGSSTAPQRGGGQLRTTYPKLPPAGAPPGAP